METLESLWEYCTKNGRVVPNPMYWSKLFQMLKNTEQKPSGGWVPGLPLILAVWYESSPIQKRMRFREYIE